MPKVIVDPASSSLDNHFAVVHTRRRSRQRFAEGCVTLMDSESAAIEAANGSRQRYGAVVYGPSISSEGLRIYYLVRWLT
jgi:hypothetical protein